MRRASPRITSLEQSVVGEVETTAKSKAKLSNIPALKSVSSNSVFDSKKKANLFVTTFTANHILISAAQHPYIEVIQNGHIQLKEPMPPQKTVHKTLQALNVNSATGQIAAYMMLIWL